MALKSQVAALLIAAAAISLAACKKKKAEPKPAPDAAAAKRIPESAIPKPDRRRANLADLESADDKVRLAAVRRIAKNPPRNRAAIDRLIALLGSERVEVRRSAATALTYVEAPQVKPPLVKALADPDEIVGLQAVMALARRGDPIVLPQVVETLDSTDSKRRTWAAGALGKLGDPAKAQWKKLVPLLDDPVPAVRYKAIRSIGKLGDAGAIEPIVAAANKHKGLLTRQAREALGDLAIDEPARAAALARIGAGQSSTR